ncbi:MAG TPA: hypothetical protein VFG07_03195, partial [Thermoplasmata archaeon]|nr:hypothetical protein [Thermoplasmata archaeon]
SGRFLHFVRMDAPIMASAPREAVQGDEKVAEAWYASIRAQYDMARRLLVENRPPEPISRAASLVGEGICSSDLEERFFYSWRALEVVGHWDLRVARDRASRGNDELARKYLEMASGPLLDGQKMQFDELRLIEISLAVRAFDVPNRRVGELKALRDAIAHGKVTAEDHLRIVKASGEILGVAHAVVASTLDSPVLLGTD